MAVERYETAMGLLNEAATYLESLANSSEDKSMESDGTDIPTSASGLASRIRAYLRSSRPTTSLGMPHIISTNNQLSEDMVIRRGDQGHFGHVRIVSDVEGQPAPAVLNSSNSTTAKP